MEYCINSQVDNSRNLNTVCLAAMGTLAYWEMSHLKFRGRFMYSGILSCATIRYQLLTHLRAHFRILGAEPAKFICNHAVLNSIIGSSY
ncbi:9536_t:CDS:2 [Funneliformis mosseae]|uniref:9536_t:CDS:1 n=1 Tax=Funneliformis mosseae TaxID=27381 RepID=A0A9N9B573_FUNMO|nr:9536_t:CDS:2 [Funneliformis mosseae]